MARKFLSALDLNKNELQNVALQNLTAAPSSPATGQIYFNTTDKTHYVYSGTAWLKFVPSGSISNADIASDAAIALSKLATDPLARANHTGTQAASTISDLATTVKAYRLDEFADPTSAVTMNGQLISGLADPASPQDAATKHYVDNAVAGLSWKESVNLLASSNVALTGTTNTLIIDSHDPLVAADSGYRILLTNQTTDSQEGIYVYDDDGSTYTLTRAADADAFDELEGATVFILEGTVYGSTSWVQSNYSLTSFSGQTWVQFNGGETVTAGNGLTKDGVILNVVGTADRISVSADAVDIASTYAGQSSIATVGTITSGTWNGSTIGVAHGGTGATTLTGYVKGSGTGALTASSTIPGSDISGDISGNAANVTGTVAVGNGGTGATTLAAGGYLKGNGTSAITSQTGVPFADVTGTVPVNQGGTNATSASGARTNLSSTSFALPQKYSATNGSLAPSSGVITWTISAETHGLGATGAIIVQLKEVSTGAVVEADILINESTGDITASWNSSSSVSSNTYRITAIG